VKKGNTTGVSHGMCPECEKKQQEELQRLISEKKDLENGETE